MRYLLFRSLLLTAMTFALPAVARTGANSSNSQTDIFAPDSTRMYAEEMRRTELIRNSHVVFMNGDENTRADRDSAQSLLEKFYVDQFRNSQDPEAPYFTFMSKDAKLAMGIGGTLALNAWYDWNGMISGASGLEFSSYLIPVPRTPETTRQLGASAAASTIFFNLMGLHTPIGEYRAFIEGGFTGFGNKGFKLKKAWFEIHDFTIGLAKTTFSDPAAQPGVLDQAGANGKVDKTNFLIRYLHTWKNRWTVAASLEMPNSQDDGIPDLTEKLPDHVPDIAALGQYQWHRGMSHVRLAAILRNFAYRDLVHMQNRHVTGWGIQLSSVVRAGRMVTLYALGSVGKGMSSYTGDLSNGDFDLLNDTDRPGYFYAPTVVTCTAGAKVQILPKLSSTLCLSTLRNFAMAGAADDTYKYGQYLAINAVYDLTSRLQAGVEYLAGKRKNCGGESGNANRALASLTFSF